MNKWLELFLRAPEDEGAGGGGTEGGSEDTSLISGDTTDTAEETVTAVEPLTREALALPDGVEFSDDLLGEFIELFNSDMSPQERANALIGLQIKTQEEAGNALAEVWKTTQEEWREATRTAFGDKLDTSLAGIRQLVDEYGTPEVLEAFDLTGSGNHPAVVGFLAKIAEVLVKEGEPVSGAPTSAPQDRASRMFPNQN